MHAMQGMCDILLRRADCSDVAKLINCMTHTDPIETTVVRNAGDVLCSDPQNVGRFGVRADGTGDNQAGVGAVGVRFDLPGAPLRGSPLRLSAQVEIPHTLQV